MILIAILGAGNAGYAHACKLVEGGHKVNLIKTSNAIHEKSFETVQKNGGIHAIDDTNGGKEYFAKLQLITRDIEEGIKGAKAIYVMTQSLQHESIANKLVPHIKQDEPDLVIIVPGNMGSIFFRKRCNNNRITFAEGESMPFDARIVEDGKVRILFKNVRNALAFLPARRTAKGVAIGEKIFDTYKYDRRNIIESALHNPNTIVHTVGTIMSASRIEYSRGEFWMYREGFTDSVWNVVMDLDREKNDVLEKFGCERLDYIDACKFRNEVDLNSDSLTVFRSYAAKGGPKGPHELNTRFILEDVPMGLRLLSSLGEKAGVQTRVCDSLIHIASSLVRRDFWKQGRTLEKLGISELTREEIINYIEA